VLAADLQTAVRDHHREADLRAVREEINHKEAHLEEAHPGVIDRKAGLREAAVPKVDLGTPELNSPTSKLSSWSMARNTPT
jgi:hypothetical protein